LARTFETVKAQVRVLSVAEGFFQTSVLFALLKTGIFETIGEGASSSEAVATAVGGDPDSVERLLNAGVMLDLLSRTADGSYSVTRDCQDVLLPTSGEAYLGDWLRNMDMFRHALLDLDQAAMSHRPTVDPGAHIGSSPSDTRDFTLAMHNYAAFRGRELAQFLDTTDAGSLLDLGCGPGTYAFNLGIQNPDLDLYLLDLPGVLDVAREVQQRYELSNSIEYLPIDVTKEPIPGEYGIVLVSNTLHMLGERNSRSLISRLHEVVRPGGSLVIQAQYLNNDRAGGRWPIYLDLIQMCITNEGRNHTEAETREWMSEAGFSDIEFVPMSLVNTNSYLRGFRS
jgi:SAM-dependent methyltransferase